MSAANEEGSYRGLLIRPQCCGLVYVRAGAQQQLDVLGSGYATAEESCRVSVSVERGRLRGVRGGVDRAWFFSSMPQVSNYGEAMCEERHRPSHPQGSGNRSD